MIPRDLRRSRKFKQPKPAVWLVLIVLIAWAIFRTFTDDAAPLAPADLGEGNHHVERVIDGDTLRVSPGETVRLIGVNTPETVKRDYPVEPWGPEASAFTKKFVAGGTVRLQFDRERIDPHGRYLAYVWVGERMLNEVLAREGLARYEPQYRYSPTMKRRFRQAQRAAQDEHRGIWSSRQPAGGRR